jgi:phosphoserine phosphatase
MQETGKRLALFDLDFTLLPHDTMFLFANYVLKRRPWRILYLLVFLPFIPLRIVGLINEVPLKRAFFSFLWRLKRGEVDALARAFVQADVTPRVYPEIRQALEAERQAGHLLVLNTASPAFLAAPIAAALGFDRYFATPLEIPERVPLLPRMRGANNKGQAKIESLRGAGLLPDAVVTDSAPPGAATGRHPRIALTASDSTDDLPMLRLAARGLLIHPNEEKFQRKLGQDIREFSDWTIQKPARPYSGRLGEFGAAVRQMLGLY